MYKKIILSLLIILIINTLEGQIQTVQVNNENKSAKIKEVYFADKNNNEYKHGSYRYYFKGQLQVSGQYENNEKTGLWTYSPNQSFLFKGNYVENNRTGRWLYFKGGDTLAILNYLENKLDGKQIGYVNGKIRTITSYKDGELDGLKLVYHDNGQIFESFTFVKNELEGEYKVFNKEGKLLCNAIYKHNQPINLEIIEDDEKLVSLRGNLVNGNGYVEDLIYNSESKSRIVVLKQNFKDSLLNGEVLNYYYSGELHFKGQYRNGFMTGKWIFYDKNGEIEKEKFYDYSNQIISDTLENITSSYSRSFVIVEEMPTFLNKDLNEFRMYIAYQLRYPEESAKKKIQGRVYVQFAINNLGELVNSKVVKSVDPLLDAEALRVINLSPYWSPGLQSGIPVKVQFTFPVVFVLQ